MQILKQPFTAKSNKPLVRNDIVIYLNFEKIYAVDRINEPCCVGIPLPKGKVSTIDNFAIKDSEFNIAPAQFKVTGKWNDNSIKWVFARFYANIYANKSAKYYFCDNSESVYVHKDSITVEDDIIDNKKIKIKLSKAKNKLFDYVEYGSKFENIISCPILVDNEDNIYDYHTESWELQEKGSLCHIYNIKGYHSLNDKKVYENNIRLTIYMNKPYFELAPRLINTTEKPLKIKSYVFNVNKNTKGQGIYTAGRSNYKTKMYTGDNAYVSVDAKSLKFESNEHNAEVFYGTFFGDYKDNELGICATVYQAQQNFPKAVNVDEKGINIMLVPESSEKVVMQGGMSREQKIEFLFHSPDMDIMDINSHSIIYQMPDKPLLTYDTFENSGVFPNIYTKNKNLDVELFLTGKADEHARCYGMMNWGDAPDVNYTEQGRGGGNLVWTNNEYDFAHASALQYARTGMRRFLDYVIVSASHCMDVDICHYSSNPLVMGGQYEHTNGHIVNGKVVCSHQWVEGFLDYYHLTGDIRGLETAIGIGENIKRLLETDKFKSHGETSARETGWALRSLTALYIETNDESWLEKCDWIVGHFKEWENKYGLWLSAYTDNTAIRVVFMISVAVGSLMRYYRINHSDEIRSMIIRAVDDLCENAVLDNGLFYYKELPSLKRMGNNPLVLEALAIAYELTGNIKYIKTGLPTLKYIMSYSAARLSMSKRIVEDTVIAGIEGTKSFAQIMQPVVTFYTFASENNLL